VDLGARRIAPKIRRSEKLVESSVGNSVFDFLPDKRDYRVAKEPTRQAAIHYGRRAWVGGKPSTALIWNIVNDCPYTERTFRSGPVVRKRNRRGIGDERIISTAARYRISSERLPADL